MFSSFSLNVMKWRPWKYRAARAIYFLLTQLVLKVHHPFRSACLIGWIKAYRATVMAYLLGADYQPGPEAARILINESRANDAYWQRSAAYRDAYLRLYEQQFAAAMEHSRQQQHQQQQRSPYQGNRFSYNFPTRHASAVVVPSSGGVDDLRGEVLMTSPREDTRDGSSYAHQGPGPCRNQQAKVRACRYIDYKCGDGRSFTSASRDVGIWDFWIYSQNRR